MSRSLLISLTLIFSTGLSAQTTLPDIPSILVETAFISNPEEEKRLKDSAYQDKMAAAVFGGIKRYLAQNPPLARSKLAAN